MKLTHTKPTSISFYTASPTSPASIDDDAGIQQSSHAVLSDESLISTLSSHDAVIVACYSVDPLVHELAALSASPFHSAQRRAAGRSTLVVQGIFEASITTALSLLQLTPARKSTSKEDDHDGNAQKWGIVTTGAFWQDHLTKGVADFLGVEVMHPSTTDGSFRLQNKRFAGVHTTGLNAGDFHKGVSKEVTEQRLKHTTKVCLKAKNTRVIIMGCAGMAGLEGIIREAAKEELGEDFAYGELHVVDAVRAALMQVEQTVKLQRLLRR